MALNKTTAELKVVETALPEKVAQKAGQVILSDDGKFFYDNTVKGRTRINPDGLKLIDTSSVNANSIVTPLTSMCCNTNYKILRLETSYNEDGWLGTITPESISLNSQYYCYIPKTGEIQDKFWEMLESDNVFIQQASSVIVNDVSYAAFTIQLIYNGDGTASDAQTLSGTLIRYPAPADSSDNYFNLALRVTDYDDSASNAQAIFESGYAFNTLRVRLRILNTNGAYVTWTGTNIQAIHGSQESADSPITFAAPIQIRNPQTGEIESIQTQEGGYIKFLGFDTVRNAIDRFDEGEEGVIQVTNSEDVNLIYASFPFEPTWVNGNYVSSTNIITALPLPYKVLKNAASVYFFRGSPNADDFAYGHISSIINDCGSFCIVNIVIDNIDDLSISLDDVTAETSGITHVDVEYTVSVVSGEAIWYHTNEYGVKFIEAIVPPVILDEVHEEADQPVRSSAIAKYIKHNVAGVYKFKGSLETSLAETILMEPEAHGVVAGYVYNVVNSGTILTVVPMDEDFIQLLYTDASTNTIVFHALADSLHVDDDYLVDLEIEVEGESILLPVVSIQADRSSIDPTIRVSTTANFTVEDAETKSFTLVAWRGQLKLNAGDNIVWNGKQWDKLAGTVDLSSYATKSEVQAVKSDLTRVLRYCGSIYCNENDSAVTTSSLRIGDVYNVYFYSDDGWGTIKLNNSDTEVVISDDGTATFVGTSIETRNGGRSETANYLRMDIAAIKSQTLTEYHWILVPTSDSFSSYTITEYDSDQPPAAGTYQVTEVSIYVDKQDNGINVVWDGIGFDRLSPAIDMSTYLSKSEIGSVVLSTETMPVSGRAVDAAIKSAISNVYKYSGSINVSQLNEPHSHVAGLVYNVADSGKVDSPAAFREVTLASWNSDDENDVFLYFYHNLEEYQNYISSLTLQEFPETSYVSPVFERGVCSFEGDTFSVVISKDDWTAEGVTYEEIIDFMQSAYELQWRVKVIGKPIEIIAGDNVVSTDYGWDKLAATVDLSPYATVEQLNAVKADISHVYRYKGSINSGDSLYSIPEIGDVYNTGNYVDFSIDLENERIFATLHVDAELRYVTIEDIPGFDMTAVGGSGEEYPELCMEIIGLIDEIDHVTIPISFRDGLTLYGDVYGVLSDYAGQYVNILLSSIQFSKDLIRSEGENIVWNGWTFDILSGNVDLSPYQLKSGVTNKVASGNKNPVQSGAVYDAIQAAVSSVYKPIGSYTVELLNRYRTDYQEFTNIFAEGNVVNIANDGLLLQPNVSETVSALDLQLISVEANSDNPALFDYVFETSSNGYYASFKAYAQRVYVDGIAIDAFEVNSDYDLVVTGDLSSIAKDVGDAFSVTWSLTDIEVLKGDNVVWTPEGWDKLAGTVDLTGYQPKLEFAAEISSENASKAVTAGPVKSYVDSEISKFLESSGSILNLVGSGQATEVGSYTFAEATTVEADTVACTITFETPSYKLMIPAIQAPVGTMLSINDEINVYIMDSYGHVTPDTVFTFEVLPDGSLTQMAISATESTNMPHIIGKLSEARINSVSIKSDRAITFDANTVVKIYGWPVVQDTNTATSINEMLKEIYDTQEAFKAQTSIPDSDSGVKTYTSVDNLPAAANSGAVAAVTSDSNTSARGMYMFINGSWQRLAFAGESLVDGDTVEVTIE